MLQGGHQCVDHLMRDDAPERDSHPPLRLG